MNKDVELSDKGLLKSTKFDDTYASKHIPDKEKEYVFCEGNDLKRRFQQVKTFSIVELGFGTGLSFLQCAKLWSETSSPEAQLHFTSIEKYPLSSQQMDVALTPYTQLSAMKELLLQHYPPLLKGFHQITFLDQRITLTLIIGDVNYALSELHTPVDAWFLDGFSPTKNEKMWSSRVFSMMASLSLPNTTFATYTASSNVRKSLIKHGFTVEKRKGFGKKREMLTGFLSKTSYSKPNKPWLQLSTSQITTKPIIIIGAGIAGIACAHRLASRGYHVKLIDSAEGVATQSSSNPYAIFSPCISRSLDNMQTTWLQQGSLYAQHFIRQHISPSHIKGLIRCGKKFDMDTTKRQELLSPLHPAFAEYLSAHQLRESHQLATTEAGLFFPDGLHINIHQLCQSLLTDFQANIDFIPNHTMTDIRKSRNGWDVIFGHRHFNGDIVILTNASSWANFKTTNYLSVQKLPGQYTSLKMEHDVRSILVKETGVIPIDDEHIVTGASYIKEDCIDSSIAAQDQENIDKLFNTLPNLQSEYSIQTHWKGTRFSTPDRLPAIGELVDPQHFKHHFAAAITGGRLPTTQFENPLAGLHTMGALGSNGLSSAFLGAEVLIAQLCQETLPIPKCLIHAINPNRFLAREIARM